jgi:hypothetical protein
MGHPSKYKPEIFNAICDRISSSSDSLKKICLEFDIDHLTFHRWLRERDDAEELRKLYARAKEEQADFMMEEMLEIADDASRDTIIKVGKGGQEYEAENVEWVNRSKLRVEARKWLAGKLRPKKWGDKVDVDLTSGGDKIQICVNLAKNED